MDTVWIRLTITGTEYLLNGVPQKLKEEEKYHYFMFGPTGIVRFYTTDNQTSLFSTAPTSVALVEESSEHILDILRKMRGTVGRLNGDQQKETSSRTTKNSKKKSKVQKNNRSL